MVSLVAEVGNQRQRRGVNPLRWCDKKLPTIPHGELQCDKLQQTLVSDEGLKKGWLANWLITEKVTGLGGSCIQLTQSDMSAHGLIVAKEITHTHTLNNTLDEGTMLPLIISSQALIL